MSRIKATVRFLHAWQCPDQIARDVEEELRFHIAKRTRANIESGMTPNEAQRAALNSFGDFQRFKTECCDISRSLPFDSTPFKMGLHITLAILAGLAALWAVNVPHHNFTGLMRQLIAIAVLTYLFVIVRRARSKRPDMSDAPSAKITAYDEQGHTPVERVFKS
jgi:hypothetical protein